MINRIYEIPLNSTVFNQAKTINSLTIKLTRPDLKVKSFATSNDNIRIISNKDYLKYNQYVIDQENSKLGIRQKIWLDNKEKGIVTLLFNENIPIYIAEDFDIPYMYEKLDIDQYHNIKKMLESESGSMQKLAIQTMLQFSYNHNKELFIGLLCSKNRLSWYHTDKFNLTTGTYKLLLGKLERDFIGWRK